MNETEKTGVTEEEKQGGLEVTRRRFLSFLFGLATAIGLGAFVAPLVRYAYPVIKPEEYPKVKVASVSDVTSEGVRFDYQDVPSELIQLKDKSFAAYSLVCTHLGCIVKWEANNHIFHCPCHGGKFDETGKNISGPPPKPLTKYKTSVQGNDIYVEGIAS